MCGKFFKLPEPCRRNYNRFIGVKLLKGGESGHFWVLSNIKIKIGLFVRNAQKIYFSLLCYYSQCRVYVSLLLQIMIKSRKNKFKKFKFRKYVTKNFF